MPFGLPLSDKFVGQLADKDDRDEFVADQVRVRIALSIRALREQRGLSQTEFGHLIGKPQSVVSRLEDPDYGKVSVQTLLEVSSALDIPLSISFPEWEDWFREIRRNSKAHLERRDFNNAVKAASARAAGATNVFQLPVSERKFSITVTTGENDGVRVSHVR